MTRASGTVPVGPFILGSVPLPCQPAATPPSNHGSASSLCVQQLKPNAVILSPPLFSFHSPTFFLTPPNQRVPQSFTQRAGLTGAALCRTGRLQSNIMSSHVLTHTHTHGHIWNTRGGVWCWHILAAANPAGTFGGFKARRDFLRSYFLAVAVTRQSRHWTLCRDFTHVDTTSKNSASGTESICFFKGPLSQI